MRKREKMTRTEEKVDELLKRDHQEARKEKNGLVEYEK
jgi:hypothetical protein